MKAFLINSKNIARGSFIWNMMGGLMTAFQSVVMLIVLSHVAGQIDAGIFVIAYANANLMYLIGKWGIRGFQVSDIAGAYSFAEYQNSRVITSLLMFVVSIIVMFWLAYYNGYSLEKTIIIGLMCVFKLIDVIQDVYEALYQKCGRLDVGSKCLTMRLLASTIVFCVAVFVFRNLLFALIISTTVSAVLMIYFVSITYPDFKFRSEAGKMNNENIAGSIKISKWKVQCSLLWVTAPLFIGTFLQFYIGNAPKYAIDSVMDDQAQAVYGYISMPVFVIGLFAMFIFGPIYHSISVLWNKGDVKGFVSLIRKQLLYTLLIAILCILLGYFFGLPVLSFLYDIDLSGYLFEFMILLVSGGFFAATTLFVLVLTIIRFQRAIVIGYLSVSVCALIFARPVVATAGMTGASILNFLFTVGLASVMGCFSIYGVKRQESSEN